MRRTPEESVKTKVGPLTKFFALALQCVAVFLGMMLFRSFLVLCVERWKESEGPVDQEVGVIFLNIRGRTFRLPDNCHMSLLRLHSGFLQIKLKP
jgi:hypothetical protein